MRTFFRCHDESALMRALLVLLASVALLIPAYGYSEPRVDPQTGMIRVLFMGDALMQGGFVTPIIAQDPIVKLTPVPVEFITGSFPSIDEAAAALRVYIPRTEKRMREDFDMVIIADAREPFFPIKIKNWIKSGVIDGGMGFLMAGGPQSLGGTGDTHPSWGPSPVGDIMPCNLIPGGGYSIGQIFYIMPASGYEDHPLVRNIPWQQVPFFAHQRVLEREGAVVVARSDRYPKDSPIIAYMDIGEGRTEVFVFDWGGNGPQLFHRWAYAPLVLSNLIYYATKVKIPDDVSAFLRLRSKLSAFYGTRSYVISIIDFAEKFGANTQKAQLELVKADGMRKEVIKQYIQGDYEASLASLDEALAAAQEASQLALKAKDQALVWVYVIEWFTVSGTAMVTGSILWTLMVKKAAYKPVAVTRFNL